MSRLLRLLSYDTPRRTAISERVSSPGRRSASILTVDRMAWGLLALVILAVAIAWYVLAGDYAWDDAFISFRYSRNLVNGYGLVWNPGGEHTQGYTNFLFVVLVAGGMKLGMSPLLAASVLNTVGLLFVVATFGTLSRALLPGHRWAWIIPPLALAFLPLVSFNMATRMETVFWSGLVLVAILAAPRAVHTQRYPYIYGSLILFFLGTLTRPETIIVAALILLYLLIRIPARMRVHVVVAAGILGVAGLVYLYWANWYFGDFLPNSFYVKINRPGTLPGLDYVIGLLRYFAALPMTYLGILGLLVIPRQQWALMLPYASVFALAIFYLFVSPLMGFGYRFLFPVACLIDFLVTMGLIVLILRMHRALFQRSTARRGTVRRAGKMIVFATALAFLGLHFWIGGYLMWLDTQSHDNPQAFANQATIGLILHDVKGIEQVVVAFGDAGRVAYYSDSKFLDVVGLNENTIARVGNQRGADWVIRYVLDQHPDLIGFYTYPDGTVYKHDHGALGSAYYTLYAQPDFQGNYTYAGGFDSHWGVYAQLFVRTKSPYADALLDAIRQRADTQELGTLHP
jgi:arabinofuranosyltransferase